ncbi:hypothetical protein LQF12_04555 [Ruania suaedae]|uniref:hypothetical protein n=1 Tax=Ruania suaedae TaxID=2897774 RepID=UPI001E4C3283|nr:hypothetical protein [Ruania suaedae]UFU03886.1 hypothetical protein LQF12_04555 [Ruania suaedae]
MTQRFNPPPGWQVPAGFTPPQGWQPDPSWPAAPAGWNYWVDDAAGYGDVSQQAGQAASSHQGGYDAAGQQGGYGTASQPGGYGQTPQAGPYDPAPATGQPGAFNPAQGAGGASLAIAEQQVKSQKRTMLVGFGIAVAAVVITVVSFLIAASSPTGGTYYFPWWFGLIGLALGIRGAVMHSKAKKQLAQAQAASGGGLYGTGMGGTDGLYR